MLKKSRRLPRSLPRIPKARHSAVTRRELNRAIDTVNVRGDILKAGLDELRRDLDVQFTRIAQLQAEFDRLKREST